MKPLEWSCRSGHLSPCRNSKAFSHILNAISRRWVHLGRRLLWAADPALYAAWMILSLTRGFSLLNSLKEPFNPPPGRACTLRWWQDHLHLTAEESRIRHLMPSPTFSLKPWLLRKCRINCALKMHRRTKTEHKADPFQETEKMERIYPASH